MISESVVVLNCCKCRSNGIQPCAKMGLLLHLKERLQNWNNANILQVSFFATYQRQQTIAETRLNFEVEMQYKAATTLTNMSGPGAKLGLRVGTRLKRAVKCYTKQ